MVLTRNWRSSGQRQGSCTNNRRWHWWWWRDIPLSLFGVVVLTLTLAPSLLMAAPRMPSTIPEEEESSRAVDEANRQFVQTLRLRALNNLQRSLESLSSLTANSLMLNVALQQPSSTETRISSSSSSNGDDNDMDSGEWEDEDSNTLFASTLTTTPPPPLPGTATTPTKTNGILRVRADIKKMPLYHLQEEEAVEENGNEVGEQQVVPLITSPPSTEQQTATTVARPRRLRSTHHHAKGHHHNNRHHHHGTVHQHKRRRKGCPTVQGKDQLLCPTRNSQRYDVCITRDQLCDRQRDCPGGEDEDPRHCFFYRPLESSLKTISHAVLLLVDTVMREQQEQQQKHRSAEL